MFETDTSSAASDPSGADLTAAYGGSPAYAAPDPADTNTAPAAGAGWNIEGILKGAADKGVDLYKSYTGYRTIARSAASAEDQARINSDLERARLAAASSSERARLNADSTIAQLQAQARTAAAKMQTFFTSPAGMLVMAVAGGFAFKLLARR